MDMTIKTLKNISKLAAAIVAILVFTGCDKVEQPIKPAILLDTTLYPGNWQEYVDLYWPVFTQNANTDRNILLEDYTGHKCPNCPDAAYEAKMIESSNPDRVFVASIHASPTGLGNFQTVATDCGTVTNPQNEFCTQLYCDEGITLGTAFGNGGTTVQFIGNPQGTINRITFSGSTMFQFKTEWAARVNEVISNNDLKVNIQAESNYYTETNGFYLHTEIEFLEDLTGDYNTVVYLLENQVEATQDSMTVIIEDYEHHSVFRGCLDGLAWGQPISGDHTAGQKSYFDYSYQLPSGQNNTEFHLLIYVYDTNTYEILQVIKHELN